MPCFHDRKNNRWSIDVTIGSAKRVRNLTGFNLLAVLDDGDALADLASDPIKLVDVLFALVQPQADKLGITDVEFGESLAGDAIDEAVNALLEAVVAFFPKARRAVMKRTLDRAKSEAEQSNAKLLALLEDGTIDRQLDQAIATASTPSTESPAPPESTPTR